MSVDPRCYLLGALLLLTVPLPWLAAAFTAAVIHELFHVAAILLCHGEILQLHIGPGGAVIHTGPFNEKQALLCALAGPAGSFLLLCFCHTFPRLAICGAVQGGFNLLPFYPLDGGRALRAGFSLLFPRWGAHMAYWIEILFSLLLFLLAVWHHSPAGYFLLIYLVCKILLRKKPCKEGIFRVQ